MDTQLKVIAHDKPLKKTVMVHELVKLTVVGHFAKDLVSCVAVADMATERKTNLPHMTNEQIVEKAFNLAELFYAGAAGRGWLIEVPPLEELQEDDGVPVGFRAAVVK